MSHLFINEKLFIMKKIITILMLTLSLSTFVNAQELTSKNGVPILPEKEEWALGIDAMPFFYYFGNMFNGNMSNGGPSFDFTGAYPMTLYGKYMVDAKTAYRVKLQITYNSLTDKELVPMDALSSVYDPDVTVEDKAKYTNMDLVFGAGLEKRRGKGRLQGIYGAEALIMFGSDKAKYEYGNNWDPDIEHHVTNFGENVINEGSAYVTEDKSGSTFGLGVRGFIGVEYFFAPKISIGGEFGWGIGFSSTGEGEYTYEFKDYDSATGEYFINTKTEKFAGSSAFGFQPDNLSGAINLLFYF
jgi:hypothetical protein